MRVEYRLNGKWYPSYQLLRMFPIKNMPQRYVDNLKLALSGLPFRIVRLY